MVSGFRFQVSSFRFLVSGYPLRSVSLKIILGGFKDLRPVVDWGIHQF